MFTLDDEFLVEVGLGAMPAAQRREFLETVYASLQERVGVKLSEGLSDAQLFEFEGLIDRDPEAIAAWIAAHAPDYASDPVYVRIWGAMGVDAEESALKAEYAATKWLEVNRPDYRDVVDVVMAGLKEEIRQNCEAILAARG